MSTKHRIISLARRGFSAEEIMDDCGVVIAEVSTVIRNARRSGDLQPDFVLPKTRQKQAPVLRHVPPGAGGGGRRRIAWRAP